LGIRLAEVRSRHREAAVELPSPLASTRTAITR
jgi:hypothetical protein